jgi:hypothetical protein
MAQTYYTTICEMNSLIKTVQYEQSSAGDYADGDDYTQHIGELEDEREQVIYELADNIGLDTLRSIRKMLTEQIDQENVWQKEAYELQKNRYTSCKSKKWFSPEDRQYIEYYKNKNEEHKAKFCELYDQRERICEMIDVLDMNDVDF